MTFEKAESSFPSYLFQGGNLFMESLEKQGVCFLTAEGGMETSLIKVSNEYRATT